MNQGSEPSSIEASARDLGAFLDAQLQGGRIEFLAGHSLGGKVVLDLLQQRQNCAPAKQVRVAQVRQYSFHAHPDGIPCIG